MTSASTAVLTLASVRTDGGTQARAMLCEETVAEYAAALGGGVSMPRVVVFYDGTDHWLADGFHRVAAYARAKRGGIPAEIRQGTRRDAVLYACGANGTHGLKRTNADKHRAVETLLRDEEWSAWSNVQIAKACGVSDMLVAKVRAEVTPNGLESTPRKGADGRTINTANIGKRPAKRAPADDAAEEPEAPPRVVAPPLPPVAPVDPPAAPPVAVPAPAAPVAPAPPPPDPDAPWWTPAAVLCAALDADLRRMAREYDARVAAFAAAYEAATRTRTGVTAHALDNLRKPRLLGAEDVARLWPAASCDCNGAIAHRCTRCRGAGFVSRDTAKTEAR